MKKITAILIIMSMLLGISSITFSATEEIVNIGSIIKDVKYVSSLTTVEDGVPVFIGIHTGTPAQLDVINLNTMSLIRSIEIEHGEAFHAMEKDSEGNVYFAGYSAPRLYKYSVKDHKVTDLGKTLSETAITDMTFDKDGNLYMGTYPNAKLLRYSPSSGVIEDLGKHLPAGDVYLKTIGYYNGYIYGGGNSSGTCLMKYDIAKKTSVKIALPSGCENIASMYHGRVNKDRFIFYCTFLDGGKSYLVYDLKNDKWVNRIDNAISGITDANGDVCYLAVNNKFYKYNLTTDEVTDTGMSVNACANPYFSDITINGVTKRYYVHRLKRSIELYDFELSKIITNADVIPEVGCPLQSVFAEGGKLYASPFMGGTGVEYNLSENKKIAEFTLGQATPIAGHNHKIYFATYPSTDLVEYDPSLAVSSSNPKTLFSLPEENQGRPMDICFAEDKIIVSTIGGYNYLEGSLVIYDTKTGTYEKNKGIIKNQSLSGLCYYNGYVYITTTVTGGIGSVEVETDCRIAKYNLKTGKIEKIITPAFKTVSGNCKMCGDIIPGPDGKLWCTSDGLVFSLNPDTLEIIDELEIEPMIWKGTSRWAPYNMIFDSKNNLYVMPNSSFYKLNIYDLTYEKLLPDSFGVVNNFTINEYDEIFFTLSSSSEVYAMNLVERNEIIPKEPKFDGEYYLISDESEFMWLKDNPDAECKLVSDISIGTERFPFSEPFEFNGTLIGDSETDLRTINVNIASSQKKVGLFSNSNGCHIENIKLTGNVKGGDQTGGFVGTLADSSTADYVFTNLINEADVQGGNEVGGIVGRSHNSTSLDFTNCKNYGNISGKQDVGGISGTLGAGVYYCANFGDITGSSKAGGIGGWATKTDIYYSYNMGEIYTSGSAAGGIIGEAMYSSSNILYCYNTGNVSSASGFAGAAFGTLSDSRGSFISKLRHFYNVGEISGRYNSVLVGDTSTCTLAKYNAFYFKADGATDDLSESLSLSDMRNVNKFLGSSTFVQSETLFRFPQLKSNINNEAFDIYAVSVKINGSGTSDISEAFVRSGETIKITTQSVGENIGLEGITVNGVKVKNPSSLYEFTPTEDSLVEFNYYECGTEKNPYIVNSRESFMKIKEKPDAYYRVTEDIEIGSYEPFAFSGTLVADEIKTLNVNINMPDSMNIGLFSELSGKFCIENIKVTGSIYGEGWVGGIAGLINVGAEGRIANCISALDYLKCNTSGKGDNSGRCIGGIVGRSYGTAKTVFYGCKNYSSIPLAKNNAGGIAGLGSGVFEYCSNYAEVRADNQLGGIAGWFTGGTINGCYNLGTMIGNQKIGGLIGHIQYNDVAVTSSFNAGLISGKKGKIGALAGSAVYTSSKKIDINDFYNIGNTLGRIASDGLFIGEVSNYTVNVNNSVTLSYEAVKGDNDLLTTTPSELEEMNFTGMSISNDKETYSYPQIVGNPCDIKIKASLLEVSYEGTGSLDNSGGFVVTTLAPVTINISCDADSGYYFTANGLICDINDYAEIKNKQITFYPSEDVDIHIVFDGIKDKTQADINKYFSYVPTLYHYAGRAWSGSPADNTVLIKETAAAFTETAQFDNWELCEWGIEVNGVKYKAYTVSENGKYGILFHGEKTKSILGKTVRGYSVYKNSDTANKITVYSLNSL